MKKYILTIIFCLLFSPLYAGTVELLDEGVSKGFVARVDAVGAGITATRTGIIGTLTIPSGGGAPTDADYLVGTANASLSAEIVASANGISLVTAANYAAMRGLLDLEAGTDFYSMSAADTAFEAELDNSTGLLAALNDEVGTGLAVFNDSPSFVDDIILAAAGVKFTGANGVLTILGLGDGADEDLTIDFNTDSNRIGINSTSSANFVLSRALRTSDGVSLGWGAGTGADPDSKIIWQVTGNDNLQMGFVCGAATDSGYFSLMEYADIGDADRSPLATSVDPVLRIYSADETNATDYIEFFHNQTTATIQSGDGAISFAGDNLVTTGTLGAGVATVTTINTGSGAMDLGDAAVANGDTNSLPTGDQVFDFCETTQNYILPSEIDTFAELDTIVADKVLVETTTAFGGDVTGNIGATVVGNDSHDHSAAGSTVTINAADITDLNAGTAITADLEEEVTEGSLADSVIVSADIKDGTVAPGDTSFMIAAGVDPDLATEGQISWDTDDDTLRGIDANAGNQVVIGQKAKIISFTVCNPDLLTETAFVPIWTNQTGFTFNITAIYSTSDVDDADYTLKYTSNDYTDNTNLTTIEAITISTNGTGCFYNAKAVGDIDDTTVETNKTIGFDNSADDVDFIHGVIIGWLDSNVACIELPEAKWETVIKKVANKIIELRRTLCDF